MNERKRTFHEDGVTCPVCDGPLDTDRDAVCRDCCPHDGGLSDAEVRLQEIRGSVDERGWHLQSFEMAVSYLLVAIGKKYTKVSPVFLDVAATLLNALDPDAMGLVMGCLPCDDDEEWVAVKRRKVPE